MPRLRRLAQHAERRREQAHEAVGERDDAAAIGLAPVGVVLQQCRIARIGRAGHAPVGDDFGQAHRVAQAQVEALARDRVQALRGIADHGEPLRDVAVGPRQR